MDLQNQLRARCSGHDEDIAFFANPDLVADGICGRALKVRVEREVIEAAISQAVAIVYSSA